MVGGWLVYDALCRSPLCGDRRGSAAVIALLQVRPPGGCATCSAAAAPSFNSAPCWARSWWRNVFFVIIPGPARAGPGQAGGPRAGSSQAALRGKLRSVHNTYFTLPVLFIMISNHYATDLRCAPQLAGADRDLRGGRLIRVYFVERHKRRLRGGKTSPWPALLGVLALAATAAALAPRAAPSTIPPAATPAAEFSAVQRIVVERCVPCHSASPTEPGFATAPQGLRLDTPEAILTHVAVIAPQVQARAMPIGNLTGMTDAERSRLLDWIRHGAPH